ncbi:MFS transporter [Cellulomonas chitinilytica]|uniref:MFS transporter n=1 Tax=Cellulomonas chitinilytica TaxID=398759 RepID=UPI001EF17120|nr:MFS transporter [Cellulomonas chitinilytica]
MSSTLVQEPEAAPTRPARSGRHANTTLVVLFLSLGGLSFALLQSLVAPALPAISADLQASVTDISWIMTAYLLSASVLTPILARLGDMAGKRKIMLVVLVLLAAGTVVAGLATSLPVLVAGRVLQGAAGAILPLSIGIVRDELPKERVSVTVGMLSAISGIGAGLGIVLAGPIVDHLSWEWLFWLPLVLVAAALVGVAVGVPESPVRTPGRLDLVGTFVLSVSLVSLLLAISKGRAWGWDSGQTLALFAVGVVGLVAFVLVELRVREPLIDMRLLAIRGVWPANAVGLTFGFLMFGTFLVIPTLLELPAATGYGFGKSITQAGLFLLPTTLMLIVFGPVAGILARKYGAKLPMVLGAVAGTAAYALPAVAHDQLWQIVASGLLSGAAIGLVFAAMSNAIIAAVPATHTGQATSVNAIVRTVGGSIGTAVVAAVIASDVTPQGIPTDHAFTLGFAVCAAVGVLAIAAALAMPSRRARAGASDEAGSAGSADDVDAELDALTAGH